MGEAKMKIIKCNCVHVVQDEIYGAGNRVANEMRTGQLKCTVCGAIQGSQFRSQPVKVAEEPAKRQKPSPKASKDKKSRAKRGMFK